MTLEQERETYNRLKPLLVKYYAGKFVLIQGSRIYGIYPSFEEAVGKGYDVLGLNTVFLVKEILEVEPIAYFSRDVMHNTAPATE